MTEVGSPTVLTRMRAFLNGEKDATLLEALRQAGKAAYGELLAGERLRETLAAEGVSLWRASPAVGSQLLATWNAYVLQTLGEAFLDADYAARPRTAGFVPPVTFGQVSEWFTAVRGWLSRARQSRANPDYDLAAELALPAALPPWVEVTPCPPEHMAAMFAAIPPVCEHAEFALHALETGDVPASHRGAVNQLRQMTAEAAAALDYALSLRTVATASPDVRLHDLIEDNLKHALGLWFTVGQLACMPRLLDRDFRPPRPAPRPDLARLPGGARFDPWVYTDPATVHQWRNSHRARQAIADLWDRDPDPAATLALKDSVDAALAAGDIAYHRDGEVTCYYETPWSPLYEVRRPLRLGGRDLGVLQQFTLRISQEGDTFVRAVVTGTFTPTSDVDFREPDR
ncbi:hypothetical protein [Longispora urticae]